MARLFERYVQYVVSTSLRGFDGTVITNSKIQGRGHIPQWGLKYIELDIIVKCNSSYFMADAKYKAHYYAFGQNSDILKETHRADLHQLLAYCSFSPEKNKTGVLFYPASNPSCRKMNYFEQLGGINNTVYLCGIPFGINGIDVSASTIRHRFSHFRQPPEAVKSAAGDDLELVCAFNQRKASAVVPLHMNVPFM